MVAKHYIPGAVPPDLDDTADFPPLPESAFAAAQSPPPGQTTVVAQPADTWVMPKLAEEPVPAAPAAAPISEDVLRSLRAESEQLRAELARSDREQDELRRKLEKVTAEREELGRQVEVRNGSLRELERRVQQEAVLTAQTQRNAALLEDRSAAAAAELEARGTELEARGAELRAVEDRLREAEARLRAAGDQLRDAEDRLRAAEDQRRAGDAERSELRARLESAQAEIALLTQQRERVAASQTEIDRDRARREAALARNQEELTELQRRVAGHCEVLRSIEGQRQVYDSQLREREAMLDEAQARLREATAARERDAAELTAAMARAAEAERQLAQRPEPVQAPPPVPAPDPELPARIAALEVELADQCALVSSLQEQLRGAHDTQQALRAELEEQAHQATAAEPRAAAMPSALAVPPMIAAAPPTVAAAPPLGAAPPPPLHEVDRLLVRTSGASGIVHVLGRRTTIGRTPDNDVRIEAEFISRHHAVVLVGTERTIVEDLNSTNGVYVNGVRVTRHELREGDRLTIGETSFRYVLKPAGSQS